MDIQSTAEKALSQVKAKGADQAMVSVSSTIAKEFNIESNRLTLLRTTFDQNLRLKTLLDQRQAVVGGNQFSPEAIQSLAQDSFTAAQASPQDEGNGFAPSQGEKKFSFGETPINEEWMYSCLTEMLKERENFFPKIIIEGGTIKFIKTEKILASSEGSLLSSRQGYYEGFAMFTAKDGKKSSSFNYTGFNFAADQAGQPLSLMKTAYLQELLQQSSEQTQVQKVPAQFEGDVIVTPHCMEDLVGHWAGFLSSDRLLKRSSFFQDKIGERVASPAWTLTSHPVDSSFASRNFWTADGYLTQNEALFEKGILKSYLLGHYAAKKLNQKATRSEGSYLKLAGGQASLKEIIGSVKKGILMCRYSAGMPAENGDISGVAKNSYYIENGEIRYPVGETMVSLNLARMLHDIKNISQETVSTGQWEMPWVQFGGATVQ